MDVVLDPALFGVQHRLEREVPPAGVIAGKIDRPIAYRPVETDGAARAAALIAALF